MSVAVANTVFEVMAFNGMPAYGVQASSSNAALSVRRQWLHMMGLTEQEINEDCILDPPTSLDDELAEYNAMFQIQDRNQRL